MSQLINDDEQVSLDLSIDYSTDSLEDQFPTDFDDLSNDEILKNPFLCDQDHPQHLAIDNSESINDLLFKDVFLTKDRQDRSHLKLKSICKKRKRDEDSVDMPCQTKVLQCSTNFEKNSEKTQTVKQDIILQPQQYEKQKYIKHDSNSLEKEQYSMLPSTDTKLEAYTKQQRITCPSLPTSVESSSGVVICNELYSRKIENSSQAYFDQKPLSLNQPYFQMLNNLLIAMKRSEWSRSKLIMHRMNSELNVVFT